MKISYKCFKIFEIFKNLCGKAPEKFLRTRFLNLINPRLFWASFWACFNFISGSETLLVRTIFILYENAIFRALLCQNSLPQQVSKTKTEVEWFGEFGHYFLQLQYLWKEWRKPLPAPATRCREFCSTANHTRTIRESIENIGENNLIRRKSLYFCERRVCKSLFVLLSWKARCLEYQRALKFQL